MAFFDNLKDNISKGIDTIGAKGKELVEETQLQFQISGLQDKRKKALEELGAVAFALFQKGALADPAAKGICDAVSALDEQIAAKQTELKSHQKEAAPSAPAPAAGAALVKCDCGAELAAGVKFCSACGKKSG